MVKTVFVFGGYGDYKVACALDNFKASFDDHDAAAEFIKQNTVSVERTPHGEIKRYQWGTWCRIEDITNKIH